MPKKPGREKVEEVWINPKSNLRGSRGDRAFDNSFRDISNSRFLELADVALGLKKALPKKKLHAAAAAGGNTGKTEPYST